MVMTFLFLLEDCYVIKKIRGRVRSINHKHHQTIDTINRQLIFPCCRFHQKPKPKIQMPTTTKNQELITYQSNDGQISFSVNVFEESVWLTQKQMAELFGKNQRTISEHINNIFKEGELEEDLVYRNFRYTTPHGAIADKSQEQSVKHYNLDVIISVGYRVKSQQGIQFRKWATGILKQYLLNGYAINERRIRALEERIDNLSVEIRREFQTEIREVNKSLLEIAKRPITINNQISLASHRLEEKVVELLGEVIGQIKDGKTRNEIEEVRKDIKSTTKDREARNNIMQFFTRLGDKNSDLHKTISGVGMSKKIIVELVKLGEKLRDLIF